MATLAGQRAQFTWSLNQYNLAEDAERRAYFAKNMAKYIAAAPANGFSVEQVTQGQSYPVEVNQYLADTTELDQTPGISEGQAIHQIAETVDTSDVLKLGSGDGGVYAYGYQCAPDRLKIGRSDGDVVERIAGQITTSTPDKPALKLEIRTHDCALLEKAIHAILKYRGQKIDGGGSEWFKVTREEVVAIYETVFA
jgi:T5orf172 domain